VILKLCFRSIAAQVIFALALAGFRSIPALAQAPPLRGYLTAHDLSTITQCKNRPDGTEDWLV